MTTKKPAPISKHKHTTTRRIVQAAPQAFDIIPRSQVRPSTTSRPVIPSNTPEVADTTLAPAPTVKLSHQTLLATKADNLIPDEPVSSSPVEQGVSVADLIAKKSEPIVITAADNDEEPKLPPLEPTPDVAPEITADPAPEPEPKLEPAKTNVESPAPSEPQLQPEPVSAPTDEPDSLAQALKSDNDGQPQEHSEALKGALKDLDGQPVHHELYGGKPVIVVHKPHGKHSALMWSLWFFLCVGLALAIVNFLLDAGVIETTYQIPYTDLL